MTSSSRRCQHDHGLPTRILGAPAMVHLEVLRASTASLLPDRASRCVVVDPVASHVHPARIRVVVTVSSGTIIGCRLISDAGEQTPQRNALPSLVPEQELNLLSNSSWRMLL